MDKPLPVDKLLRTGTVQALVARAHAQRALEAQVHAALEPALGALARTVRAGELRGGVLTLVVPGAALATRLRLGEAAVVAALRGAGGLLEAVTAVQLRVATSAAMASPIGPPKPAPTPSQPRPDAADALREAAGTLRDTALADAVRRLAGHLDAGES